MKDIIFVSVLSISRRTKANAGEFKTKVNIQIVSNDVINCSNSNSTFGVSHLRKIQIQHKKMCVSFWKNYFTSTNLQFLSRLVKETSWAGSIGTTTSWDLNCLWKDLAKPLSFLSSSTAALSSALLEQLLCAEIRTKFGHFCNACCSLRAVTAAMFVFCCFLSLAQLAAPAELKKRNFSSRCTRGAQKFANSWLYWAGKL